jgi:hypothetical protein
MELGLLLQEHYHLNNTKKYFKISLLDLLFYTWITTWALKIKQKLILIIFKHYFFYLEYHSLINRLVLEILDLLLFQVGPDIVSINSDYISKENMKLTVGPGGPTEPGIPGVPGGPGQLYQHIHRHEIFLKILYSQKHLDVLVNQDHRVVQVQYQQNPMNHPVHPN